MSRCPSPTCWGPSDCAHDDPPYSWALQGLPDKARAKALAELRPRGSLGRDRAGWHLTALPEQWTRGVNADEWIEYVPAPSGTCVDCGAGKCVCGHP